MLSRKERMIIKREREINAQRDKIRILDAAMSINGKYPDGLIGALQEWRYRESILLDYLEGNK